MLKPSRPNALHTHLYRPFVQPLAIGCALAFASGCASFFKLSPEEEAAGAAAKPAAGTTAAPKAAPKVEKPKAEKPKPDTAPRAVAPKPTAPKPAEPKPETKVAEKPVEKPAEKAVAKKPEPAPKPVKEVPPPKPDKSAKAAAPAPAPPEERRSEPVVEPAALEPAPAGSDSAGVARLMNAAALWDVVRLFHPTAATHRVQWDNETVRRLTDVRTANTREQYAAVMREWISRLNDPATRVIAGAGEAFASDDAISAAVTVQQQVVVTGTKKNRVVDTTVVLTWPSDASSTNTNAWNSLRDAVGGLSNVSQLVIDLRTTRPSNVSFEQQTAVRDQQLKVAGALSSRTVAGPSIRRRVYEGWTDENATGAALPDVAWRVSAPIVTVRGEAPARARRVVFVANANTAMPPALLALVASKQASLVADAPLDDHLLVPVRRVPVGAELTATVRVGELINADGSVGIQPDTLVAPSANADSAPAIRTALQMARGKVAAGVRPKAAQPEWSAGTVASADWSNAHYPIMGARLLSLFSMAGTLRGFHAYGELRDESLDDALTRFVPRVEAATDAYSFSSAMLDFATTMNDAQAVISSPTIEQHLGTAAAPFAVRWIEGRAIVTQVAADDAGRATGLSAGDEITAADGYPMPAYVTEHRRYGPASNEWTASRNTARLIPRGPPGDGMYKIRDASNRERATNIPRSSTYRNYFPEHGRASTSVFRSFTGGIGYLDLERATSEQVDSAFQIVSSARALIIDARGMGSPNASGGMTPAMLNVIRRVAAVPSAVIDKQTIRISSEPCVPALLVRASQPTLQSPATPCVLERRQIEDVIVSDTANRYKGRLVVLIDERTQGAMEQFGLAIESVANPVFIGGPSAGAAGALTTARLPGLITLTFSGSELRHADGRQLQRIGLTPQVDAEPTVKGVRAGSDEVLARAQEWLLQQLDPAAPKRRR